MALTTEQIDFAKAKNTTVTNTAAKLMEFFKPINEEGLIVKDFKSSFLGGTDGMGFLGIGCIGGFVLPIIIGIICAILDFSDNNIVILCELTLVVMIEFSIIGYIYNKIFLSKHPGAPGDPDRLTHLIMPLIGFLSQDLKDDEQITVKSALVPLNSDTFKLSHNQIEDLGKRSKRGLDVYSGELLELTTRMADGTAASFNVSEVLSTVYVYKKHGSDKRSRKEKVTIKAGFAFPANAYGNTQEGEYELDENTSAVVTTSEKRVKVVVKKVIGGSSDTSNTDVCVTSQQILNGCVDAMAAAYSIVG